MTPGWAPSIALALALLAASGCGEGPEPAVEPLFPADYEDTYVEVRDCRASGDHDLNNIRILASPGALEPYEGRVEPFPVEAVVLKEEFDFGDTTCAGPIVQWTVMRRLTEGASPDTLNWAWQTVDLERAVVDEDGPTCIGCHQSCGGPPDGYEGTCALP